MKKKIFSILFAMIVSSIGVAMLVPSEVGAAGAIVETVETSGTCAKRLLGFRPWYLGLQTKNSNGMCEVGTPADLPIFVWTIVLNVLADLFLALGYAAIGFAIWGGWLYMRSGGDPGVVAKGKKTLTNAVIGMVIAILATVITNTIIFVLTSAIS